MVQSYDTALHNEKNYPPLNCNIMDKCWVKKPNIFLFNKILNRQTYSLIWEEEKGRGSDGGTKGMGFQESDTSLYLGGGQSHGCVHFVTLYILWFVYFFWTYILLQLNIYLKYSTLSPYSPTLPPLEHLPIWEWLIQVPIILHQNYSWFNFELTVASSLFP